MVPQNAGEIVELAIRRKNVNISELSRKINVNRRTLYNWFQQETLSSTVIYAISQAIDYDFSEEFPEGYFKTRPNSHKQVETDVNQSDTDRTQFYWMKKYISLLEDYRVLLEKYNSTQVAEDSTSSYLKYS